jgi:hypothetical protein
MFSSLPNNVAHYTNKSMEVCVNRQVAGLEIGHGLYVVPSPTVQTIRQVATLSQSRISVRLTITMRFSNLFGLERGIKYD